MRDRAATRALILGVLSLPFAVLAPFAIWSGVRSLSRIRASGGKLRGGWSATVGVAAGITGATFCITGLALWLVSS